MFDGDDNDDKKDDAMCHVQQMLKTGDYPAWRWRSTRQSSYTQ